MRYGAAKVYFSARIIAKICEQAQSRTNVSHFSKDAARGLLLTRFQTRPRISTKCVDPSVRPSARSSVSVYELILKTRGLASQCMNLF